MLIELSVLFSVLLVCLYVWLTWNNTHWKNLEIPYLEPKLLFGNLKDFTLLRKCKGLVYDDLYWKSEEPAVGIFSSRQPQLLIRDSSLAKIIFINEFHMFSDNDYYSEQTDFFHANHAFFMTGQKWKATRNKVLPALTTGKLKIYMPQMTAACRDMVDYINENSDKEFEAKYFSGLYTTDLAMSSVYGINSNSFKDPGSNFRKAIDNIISPGFFACAKYSIACLFPAIGHLFKIGMTSKGFYEFYIGVVREAVNYRKSNKVKRNDFLQYILDSSGKDGSSEYSIHDITGYTMNVIADAAETTSTVISQTIDILLRYPDAQKKLIEEIDKKISSLDDITYDNVQSITYLNSFIAEVLRMRPLMPVIERLCTQDGKVSFDGKRYKFKKGDKVAASIYSMQMDPKYFPDPQEFKPERFMNSEDQPGYWPFGFGPRACLGKQFGQMEIKVFLCGLLKRFEVIPARILTPKVEFDPKSPFVLIVKDGVWFKVKQRQ